jgi:hypothetical protein
MPADSPAFWPLEAEPDELRDYVASRLVKPVTSGAGQDDFPVEPAWVREVFEASWAWILTEADAW